MNWNIFTSNKKEVKHVEDKKSNPLFSQFSTPFGKIGGGDLALPYVRSNEYDPYVRFSNNGTNDNLFPQVINQLYYTPLNGAIINFKVNAVIGGGMEIESPISTAKQRLDELVFLKKNKFKKVMRMLTKDLIMHGRINVLIIPEKGGKRIERISPEKSRHNKAKTIFTICDDWSNSTAIRKYNVYSPSATEPTIYYYEIDCDAGQDDYPLPSYCSANNWSFLDGQMSYLQKSNIINSIFPSMMITLAKEFDNTEELESFKKTVDDAKGAPSAGRIMTFIGTDKESLPTITPIPTQQNDKLFTQTDERLDAAICRAHQIDPLIMGIRVSGKLGSGTELPQAYLIFEKNVVLPLREMIKEVGEDLLEMCNMQSTLIINNFQIINDQIIDKTENNLK